MSELKEAIQAMIPTKGDTVICTVKSVDEQSRTCTATTASGVSGVEIPNVQLMASIDDGMLLIPAVDSNIIVQWTNDVQPYVIMYSELSKVLYIVGDNAIEISEVLKLCGDEYGGLIKIEELVSKLNAVEKDLNSIKNVFSSWTPVSQDGGAALKTAAATWYGATITETQKSELENQTVTHGSGI